MLWYQLKSWNDLGENIFVPQTNVEYFRRTEITKLSIVISVLPGYHTCAV